MKSLLLKDNYIDQIKLYHRQLAASMASFQVSDTCLFIHAHSNGSRNQMSALIDIQGWQAENKNARKEDLRVLHNKLSLLESNQKKLASVLGESHPHITIPNPDYTQRNASY